VTQFRPATLTDPVDTRFAAQLLTGWGFVIHPDLPDMAGDAYLLVAMRERPELDHFDPERVDLWVSRDGRGVPLQLTRQSPPYDGEYSWGTIAIRDRLGVTNQYVSTGGHLTFGDVDGLSMAIFVSPAPILRRGGHSQGWDAAAADLAAWFARLMIAVDYVPGFEARLAAAGSSARYAAFVADAARRHRPSPTLRDEHEALWPLLCAEAHRMAHDHPAAWADGLAILEAAHLDLPPG
jgi:hypothetical protein